ncbi:MAG: replicative DNA helicase [Bacteroides sp.]|nr:MAG: replicative DNA helicase [Bacteroides sp.]
MKIENSYIPFGKIPPQSIEVERIVLGSILLEKEALIKVIEFLYPEMFYDPLHQKIYQSFKNLFESNEPIDIITVNERLNKDNTFKNDDAFSYVMKLTNNVASASNIEYHAKIIAEKYIRRKLISTSSDIITSSYDDTIDTFDLLDKTEEKLFNITEYNVKRNFFSLSKLLKKSLDQIKYLIDNKSDDIIGIPSGFNELDGITSGFQKSDLIIIAGRPGMGKTAFGLSIMRNFVHITQKAVALFSMEMSAIQIANRLISSEIEIPQNKIRKGKLSQNEWMLLHDKINPLMNSPIFIDDTPALSIFELKAKCRRMKSQHNIDLIVIDYLQLMRHNNNNSRYSNREQEISNISRSLKSIAKELDIPVIALSQLSREVEKRGGIRRPVLSDLRESGSIEQDADLVLFIYRPEYYGIIENEDGIPTNNLAEIIIAKHRNGETGKIYTKYINEYVKFTNWKQDNIIIGNTDVLF